MTMVWSSLSLFSNLTASLDEIFRVPNGRNIWKLRLQAIGISLALVVLVIASFVTAACCACSRYCCWTSPACG